MAAPVQQDNMSGTGGRNLSGGLAPGNFSSEELGALFDELPIVGELLEFAALFGEFPQGLSFALEALLQDHHCTCCCRHGLTFYFWLLSEGDTEESRQI